MARCICYQQKWNNHGKRSFKIIILFANLKSISRCEFFDGLYFQVCSPRFGERVRGKCYYSRGNLPFESYTPWNEGKLLIYCLWSITFSKFLTLLDICQLGFSSALSSVCSKFMVINILSKTLQWGRMEIDFTLEGQAVQKMLVCHAFVRIVIAGNKIIPYINL